MERSKKFFVAAAAAGVALCAVAYFSNADAADLGGNCCADLEERIAELEATTARKGTRKVSLSVYGQISEGLLFWDANGNSDAVVQSNGAADSFIGFTGSSKFDAGWEGGFILEIGTGGYEYGVGAGPNTHEIYTRTAALYLEGPVGRVTLGHYSQATDGIAEITTANTAVASRMLSLRPLTGPEIGEVADLFDGTRGDVVRYDTPLMVGFRASASWSSGVNDTDVYDFALRYAGEMGGFRLAAGVGYRDGLIIPSVASIGDSVQVISGSASIMHITSGLFVNAAAGDLDVDFSNDSLRGLHVQGGIEQKFFSLGKTTLFAEWGQAKIDGSNDELTVWGGGVVQAIDAAAMDLFVNARQIEIGNDDALVGMAGARLRF